MEQRAKTHFNWFIHSFSKCGIIVAIVVLGKITTNKEWQYYIVQFDESISGLSVGSAVEYSGLKIGEVERLELQPNPNYVNAYIKIDADVQVHSDVVAMLSLVGVTGQSVIALSGGTKDSPVLKVNFIIGQSLGQPLRLFLSYFPVVRV